jgi:DNA-binding Lrp family transcriptional regulator
MWLLCPLASKSKHWLFTRQEVREMRSRSVESKKDYRLIFELVKEAPRVSQKDCARIIKIRPSSAVLRMNEAFNEGYIVGPQIRKKSFKNFPEYVYLIKSDNPIRLYRNFITNEHVLYHAIMDGFANIWAITDEILEIDEKVVVWGRRSDFYISFPPDHSWDHAIEVIEEMIDQFDPETYTPKNLIETHWDEEITWDDRDEILSQEFKHNLRKPVNPIAKKKHHMGVYKAYEWLDRLHECFTVLTCYFPNTVSKYDPYLFVFETDYEDFVVELFSQLPSTTYFFRVSGRLFMLTRVERREVNIALPFMNEITRLQIPLLAMKLLEKGIIKSEEHASVECFWRDEAGNL